MGEEILIAMTKKSNFLKKQKESLILHGVKKLKIIGFSNVTKHNILTDEMYQRYFLNFLKKICSTKRKDEISAIKELKAHIMNLFELKNNRTNIKD
ncbi:hypothetical protein [Yeosuana sp. AK3]